MFQFPIHTYIKVLLVAGMSVLASAFTYPESLSKPQYVSLDDNNISPAQQRKYRNDATRLALRYIAKGSSYETLGAEVPKEVMDELYSALVAVHKSPFREAVEVTREHRLHTFPNPVVDKFQVNYKNTAKWAVPLRLGDNVTDSDLINRLCSKYKLNIDSHRTWDSEHNLFIVKAESALNMAAVAKEFRKEEGIDLVNLPIPSADGNDIEAVRTAKGWRLDYIVKFDSCFSGCKKKHVWSFEISGISRSGANVNFIGTSGDELPAWMRRD